MTQLVRKVTNHGRGVARKSAGRMKATGRSAAERIESLVSRWAHRHAADIEACYYSRYGRCHIVQVVPKSGRFSPRLSSESAALDSQVVRALPAIEFESLQVPPDHDFSKSRLIYGERSGAAGEVPA